MQTDHVTRALLGSILVCGLVLLVQGQRAGEAAAEPSAGERFQLLTVARRNDSVLLIRLDSATGEAWGMSLLGEGRWDPIAEGPEGAPSPDAREPGRYSIVGVGQRRGAPTLVRTDHRSGRSWRVASTNQGPWVPIPNPPNGAAAPAEPASGSDSGAR